MLLNVDEYCRRGFANPGLATFAWDGGDEAAQRLAAVQLVRLGAAGQKQVATAFGTDPVTVCRWDRSLRERGAADENDAVDVAQLDACVLGHAWNGRADHVEGLDRVDASASPRRRDSRPEFAATVSACLLAEALSMQRVWTKSGPPIRRVATTYRPSERRS